MCSELVDRPPGSGRLAPMPCTSSLKWGEGPSTFHCMTPAVIIINFTIKFMEAIYDCVYITFYGNYRDKTAASGELHVRPFQSPTLKVVLALIFQECTAHNAHLRSTSHIAAVLLWVGRYLNKLLVYLTRTMMAIPARILMNVPVLSLATDAVGRGLNKG